MTLQDLKTTCQNLEKRINSLPILNNGMPIADGVIEPETYFKSNPRILFVLKEAYEDSNDPEYVKGDWDYRDLFCDSRIDQVVRSSWRTWYPIIYTLYGVEQDGVPYLEMPAISSKPEMKNLLRSIAIVNLKKYPGTTRSKHNDIRTHYLGHREIIHDQIAGYNPDVIIYGGTFSIVEPNLNIQVTKEIEGSLHYYFYENRLHINAYHPSYPAKGTSYVDDLVKVILRYFPKATISS